MSKLWSSFLEFIRILGNNSGCHQISERSFFYKGYQFPVCARCTGVAFGQLSSIILFVLKVRLSFITSCCMLIPMAVDWSLQYINIKQSTNIRRFITGIMGGFGLFSIYFNIILYIIKLIKNFNKKYL